MYQYSLQLYNIFYQLYSSINKRMLFDGTLLKKVDKISQTDLKPDQTVLSTVFQLFCDGEVIKEVTAFLCPECIRIDIQDHLELDAIDSYEISFDFDLKFELLRPNQGKKKWHPDQCYSIRLIKNDKTLELRKPQKQQDFTIWRNALAKVLNQVGFHQIFHPIKQIGRGNFGNVYLVLSNETKQLFAIKAFLKEEAYSEERGKQSLLNEISVMRDLNHKNIMKFEGVYQSKNSIYMCVELLEGGELYTLMKTRRKFSCRETKVIMKNILEGVEHMHSRGYMHRDLKPQNILFRKEQGYECVIADFGLAEKVNKKELLFMRCGTPGYIAPEVANLKSKVLYTEICDLFSVGVIFHILVLGRPPFIGKSQNEVLELNKLCKINFQSYQYQQLQPQTLDLLKGLLQKDPKKRISAVQALKHQYFVHESSPKNQNGDLSLSYKQKQEVLTELPLKNQIVPKNKKISVDVEPLTLVKNQNGKKLSVLRDDSCLKLKMKENAMVEKSQQSGKQIAEINTPLLNEKTNAKVCKSRFKNVANTNS